MIRITKPGGRIVAQENDLLGENTIDTGLAAMQARIDRPEGVALFHWDRATARNKGGGATKSAVAP